MERDERVLYILLNTQSARIRVHIILLWSFKNARSVTLFSYFVDCVTFVDIVITYTFTNYYSSSIHVVDDFADLRRKPCPYFIYESMTVFH